MSVDGRYCRTLRMWMPVRLCEAVRISRSRVPDEKISVLVERYARASGNLAVCRSNFSLVTHLLVLDNSMGISIENGNRPVSIDFVEQRGSGVDLPAPVGPVTRTSPLGLSQSSIIGGGSLSLSRGTTSNGMARKTTPIPFRWSNTLTRKRESPWIPKERSSSCLSSKIEICFSLITL